jgi:hypothetical protein
METVGYEKDNDFRTKGLEGVITKGQKVLTGDMGRRKAVKACT